MKKLLTFSDLFVAAHRYTNTSPSTIIQPAREYCAAVGCQVVTWNEVKCLTSYISQSTQFSNFTYKITISLGGGVHITQLYVPEDRNVK